MKKTLIALSTTLAATVAVNHHVAADTILGVYVGAGIWQFDYDGGLASDTNVISETFTLDDLGLDNESSNYFYAALEHPVPVIPNIKIQYTDISSEEENTITREIIFDDQTFSANSQVSTDLDLTHTDLTFYYEVLDNWISLDLGLTARIFDGFIKLSASDPLDPTNTIRAEETVDETIPMIYGKAQFDFPLTGWFFGATVNVISVSGNTLSDVEAKIGYMSDGLPVLDIGFELGYRQLKLEVDELDDDLEVDVTLDGPYVSLVLHF